MHEVLDGLDVGIELTDAANGALPGLTAPAAAALVDAAGGQVRAKYGWTDVARFAALGIPAVNYGPGDPNLAHRVDEHVDTAAITAATETLRQIFNRLTPIRTLEACGETTTPVSGSSRFCTRDLSHVFSFHRLFRRVVRIRPTAQPCSPTCPSPSATAAPAWSRPTVPVRARCSS